METTKPCPKIALITAIPSEHSFSSFQLQLKKNCLKRGVMLDLFKNGEFSYFVKQGEIYLSYGKKPIRPEDYSLVLVRFTIREPHGGNHYAIRLFERKKIPVINPTQSLLKAKDKLQTLELLAKEGLPVTPTVVVRTKQQIETALDWLGNPPYIIKGCFSSQGKQVLQATNKAQVYALFDYAWDHDRNEILLLQPCLGNSPASDIRVLCFHYKVWRAMLRVAKAGEFRSNLHTGAQGIPISLEEEEIKICEYATKILDLPFAGIDFLRTDKGPMILEVNGCPGLMGITQAYVLQGIDLMEEFTSLLIDYLHF